MPEFTLVLEDKDNNRQTVNAFGDTPLDAIFSCKEVVGKLVLSCLPLSCVKPA